MMRFFIMLLNMSIAASFVAAAVMLLRIVLQRAPKLFSYLLWLVVLLRLICPFSITSTTSILPTNREIIPPTIVTAQQPRITSGIPAVDEAVNGYIRETVQPAISATGVHPIALAFTGGLYVWLCGLVTLLLYAAVGYLRLKRRVATATLLRDNLYETDRIGTAFVLGIFHPKIYIPTALQEKPLRFILEHEQVHIRRLDYLIKPFAFIILAIHWFNPIIWVSYYLMAKDMELSCDEAVLRKEGDDMRRDYSVSLVTLYTQKLDLFSPLAFGEGSMRDRKARIKNVLRFKKVSPRTIVFCSLLLVLLFVGFMTNPAQTPTSTTDSVQEAATSQPAIPLPEEPSSLSEVANSLPDNQSRVERINLPDEYYVKTAPGDDEKIGDYGNLYNGFTLQEARDFSVNVHKDNGRFELSIVNRDTGNEVLYEAALADTETDIEDTVHLEPGSYSLRLKEYFFRGSIDISSSK